VKPSRRDTVPHVFIIESLRLDDEKHERFEGRILQQILRLNEKDSAYYYIRTRRELERIMKVFAKSRYRYLHLSCHGSSSTMETTFDSLEFENVGRILRPHLQGRRVFVSACEMANRALASQLIAGSGCFSLIGPATAVRFSDAALLWSSFYHLVFRTNGEVMQRKSVLEHLRSTASLFRVRMNYFSKSKSHGIKTTTVKPVTERS